MSPRLGLFNGLQVSWNWNTNETISNENDTFLIVYLEKALNTADLKVSDEFMNSLLIVNDNICRLLDEIIHLFVQKGIKTNKMLLNGGFLVVFKHLLQPITNVQIKANLYSEQGC